MLGTPEPAESKLLSSLQTGWTERGLICWFHTFCLSGSLFGCCKSHHQQPVLGYRILHCECADLPPPPPACSVPSTPRKREGMMQAQRLKWPCVPHKPPYFSALTVRPRGPYTQSIPLRIGHKGCVLIHSLSYLPRAGRVLGTTALRIEYEEKEKTWPLLLSGLTTRETHASTPSMHKHKLNSFSLILILLIHNL